MRDKIVAGNWKMNKSFDEAEELLNQIVDELEKNPLNEDVTLVICPPVIYLEMALDLVLELDCSIGAQNLSQFDDGAYTGEISARMLSDMGIDYCIVGHSERRQYFGETDEIIAKKVLKALDQGIAPIFCCGESLAEREAGIHFDVVKRQIETALWNLNADNLNDVVIAYEPVWAIGTGKVATPDQAQEMHAFIRSLIASKYGTEFANEFPILYGGSCNAANAAQLFSQPDVDGGLIGGASLKAEDFLQIARSFPIQ